MLAPPPPPPPFPPPSAPARVEERKRKRKQVTSQRKSNERIDEWLAMTTTRRLESFKLNSIGPIHST